MFDTERLNKYLPDKYRFLTKTHSESYHIGESGYIIPTDELAAADFTFTHKDIAGLLDLSAIIPNAKRFAIRCSAARSATANCKNLIKKCAANQIPLVCVLPNTSRQEDISFRLNGISEAAILDLTRIYGKNKAELEWLLHLSKMTKGSYRELSEACSSIFISLLLNNAADLMASGEAQIYHNGRIYCLTEVDKLVNSIFPLNCDYFYPETSYACKKTTAFRHFFALGMGTEKPNNRSAALNLNDLCQISLFSKNTAIDTEESLREELSRILADKGYFSVMDIIDLVTHPPFGFSFNNLECYILGDALRHFSQLLFQDVASLTYRAGAATFLNQLSQIIMVQHLGGRMKPVEERHARTGYFFEHMPYINVFIEETSRIFGIHRGDYLTASVIMRVRDSINTFRHIFYFIEEYFAEKGEYAYSELTNIYYRLCAAGGYSTFEQELELFQRAAEILTQIDIEAYRAALTEENIKHGMDIYFNAADYSRLFEIIPQAGRWLWNKEAYGEYKEAHLEKQEA